MKKLIKYFLFYPICYPIAFIVSIIGVIIYHLYEVYNHAILLSSFNYIAKTVTFIGSIERFLNKS